MLLGTALDSLQRRHLGTVRQSARSLLELLNDILDMAKLEKGATELELVDFSLPDLVDHVAASLRVTAHARELVLHVDIDPGMGQFFLGDARRVQQVLTNLIGNAVKFTEAGHVRVAVGMQGDRVHIAVHDTGIGIPADRLDKIFAPFTQADSSMSRRFGGTGLGTTISLQLVELMGGTITVESTLGVGSVFHVLLPLAPGKAVARRSEQAVVALPPLRILAADDVPQNVELLLISLGAAGHQVITAGDGESAVREFGKGSFDIVLMDVQMPRMDGLEAARLIRVHEREQGLKATPIIALTASVLEQDRRAAQTAGMNGFASKPLEMHKLTAEIARLLDIAVATPPPASGAAARAGSGQVDWQRGIALWGGRATLQRAIARFVQANGDCAPCWRRNWSVATAAWPATCCTVSRARRAICAWCRWKACWAASNRPSRASCRRPNCWCSWPPPSWRWPASSRRTPGRRCCRRARRLPVRPSMPPPPAPCCARPSPAWKGASWTTP